MAVDEMKFTVVRGQCNDHDGEPDSSAGVSFVEEGRNAWRSGVAVRGGGENHHHLTRRCQSMIKTMAQALAIDVGDLDRSNLS